jgi:hypothetical protein
MDTAKTSRELGHIADLREQEREHFRNCRDSQCEMCLLIRKRLLDALEVENA